MRKKAGGGRKEKKGRRRGSKGGRKGEGGSGERRGSLPQSEHPFLTLDLPKENLDISMCVYLFLHTQSICKMQDTNKRVYQNLSLLSI